MNPKEILYSNLQTMTVDEYQKYVNEADLGYIKINHHPEDENLVILNYTELTTFERRWNEQTLASRGLILDLTDAKDNGIVYIMAKPFGKFFNYGENPEYEKDIDFDEIESIMEKMDGSLGISYFFNDEIRFATRGSFTSEQAIKATEMWREKYASYNNIRTHAMLPITYLVEIIYPENRVVVDYKGKEELVLLGVTYMFSGLKDMGLDAIEFEAERVNMRYAPFYNHLSLKQLLEMKKSLPANEEGFVIKFKNGKRLKIKGDEYLQVHKIKHGMSTKAKYQAWADGTLEGYIMMLPEEFRPELEKFEKDVENIFTIVHNSLYLLYKACFDEDRKQFALKVQQRVPKEYWKFMFEIFKTQQVPEIMIKQDIAKNYIAFEEVIEWLNKQDS